MKVSTKSRPSFTNLRTIFNTGETWANTIGVALFVLIMLSVTADVITRYITGSSITGVFELNELLMVGCFLILSYTQLRKGHVTVEFVLEHISVKARHTCELIALILTFATSVLFFWQSVEQSQLTISMRLYSDGIVQYPLSPARVLVSIGFLLLCIRMGIQLIDMFVAMTRRAEATKA